jgi:signal transduction histidine kinase
MQSSGSRTCLENLSTVVGQKAYEKNLAFLISAQPDIPPYLIDDPLRLGQIHINLVNGAVKLTNRGEVIVTAKVEDSTEDSNSRNFGQRFGHRHDRGTALEAVSGVHSVGHIDDTHIRRHGPQSVNVWSR